jgi:hypothetical protein
MCGFGNLSQKALESFGKVLEILTGDPVRTLFMFFETTIPLAKPFLAKHHIRKYSLKAIYI